MSLTIDGSARSVAGPIHIPDDPPPSKPLPATADIDGNRGDQLGRPNKGTISNGNRQTTDGKPVQQDPLFENGNVNIQRERTYRAEDTNGDGRPDQADQTSDQVVIETKGNGDDRIDIDQTGTDPDGTKHVEVKVNGERYTVALAPGQQITLKTGDGNDTIWADPDVDINLTVDSGAGDDFIFTGAGNDKIDAGTGNDTVYANGGRDDVFGNSGDDHISGGDGNDVVYGGDGNDFITGVDGNDYLEGGAGNDTVWGGAGNDIVSGGRGDDRLEGDGGNDTVYAGAGKDSIENTSGKDTVYAEKGDHVTIGKYADKSASNVVVNVVVSNVQGVTVEGSDAFRQRTEADIDLMRASPSGQQLLTSLEGANHRGNTVVIRELQDENNGFAAPVRNPGGSFNDRFATAKGPGAGTDAEVYINPTFHTDADPGTASDVGFPNPLIVTYHELSHAYNDVTGTMQAGQYGGKGTDGPHSVVVIDPNTGQPVKIPVAGINNAERQAVGLPTDAAVGTPNPQYATENGIRAEMSLPDRSVYRTW